jgi:hypothetical protein
MNTKSNNQRFASCKTLMAHLGIDKGTATEIRGLVKGQIDPAGYPSVHYWMKQCYHTPSHSAQVLEALNGLLGGFGVEVIRGEEVNDILADYINMGDTYISTILLDHQESRYLLTSCGDFVETNNL